MTVVNCIFDALSFIGQIEPVLHKVCTQHRLDAKRRASPFAGRVVRRYQGDPTSPRDNFIHVLKKCFSPGFSSTICASHINEAELGHLLFSFDVGLEQLNYTISREQTAI